MWQGEEKGELQDGAAQLTIEQVRYTSSTGPSLPMRMISGEYESDNGYDLTDCTDSIYGGPIVNSAGSLCPTCCASWKASGKCDGRSKVLNGLLVSSICCATCGTGERVDCVLAVLPTPQQLQPGALGHPP